MAVSPLLEVRDLTVSFRTDDGVVRAVDGVSFAVQRGQTLGVVGESGCGKSVTAFSLMRLLPKPAGVIERGAVLLDGVDLLKLSPAEMARIRGKRISMIFQEPMAALNPVHTIGKQLAEVLRLHEGDRGREWARSESQRLLEHVGIPEAARRLDQYPHHLSGGMRQRVVIAMALACSPSLLIADEPTTALDVTMQAQVLELMRSLQTEHEMALLFITHDLGLVGDMCDDVIVMYAGRIVEYAPVATVFARPAHPYTKGLLASRPSLFDKPKTRLTTIEGAVPSLHQLPRGCAFQSRCPSVSDRCLQNRPTLTSLAPGHDVACFHPGEPDR